MNTVQDMMKDRHWPPLRPGPPYAPHSVYSNDLVIVVFLHCQKLGVVNFRECLSFCTSHEKEHIIIIPMHTWTNDVSESAHVANVQLFSMDELVYNPTMHNYVPDHRQASASEVRQLIKDTGCTNIDDMRACLPKLNLSDIVCRYYGWPLGTVVRVQRVYDILRPQAVFRVVTA